MEPRTYDIVNTNISKAQDISTELLLSLNVGEGGEISRSLMSLYLYFKKRLLEANVHNSCDAVWVVTAPEQALLSRLVQRRGLTVQEARRRLANQSPQELSLIHISEPTSTY